MKRSHKITLGAAFIALGAILISSCTTSFCTNEEIARMMYVYEPGVSVYATKEGAESAIETYGSDLVVTEQVFENNDDLYRVVIYDEDGGYANSAVLTSLISSAEDYGLYIPTLEYFTKIDTEVLLLAINSYNDDIENDTPTASVRVEGENYQTVSSEDITAEEVELLLTYYGYEKFYGDDETLFLNYEIIDANVKKEIGLEKSASTDFKTLYTNTINSAFSSSRSCIALITGEYGSYGTNGESVLIEGKSWSYAWSKGPIEGLLVYPVASLLDSLTYSFGGVDTNGWIQLAALFVTTIIVRTILLLATFWSTLSQQKMQALQPEVSKIQSKYPNANTNQSEKMRLSQETALLYKKYKVRPFLSLLVLIIQFPLFIGVWGGISGSAVLSTGTLLNLQLSTSLSTAFLNFSDGWAVNSYGFWTAVIIFLLMAASQFVAMKLPQWLMKRKNKNISKLSKNPTQDQQQKTMRIVSWVMLIMIIVMGLTLPAAMAIYWIFGAIYSVGQTLIIQLLIAPKLVKHMRNKMKNKK